MTLAEKLTIVFGGHRETEWQALGDAFRERSYIPHDTGGDSTRNYKFLFVIMMQQGRPRPCDVHAINKFCDGVSSEHFTYGVIASCGPRAARECSVEVYLSLLSVHCTKPPSHLLFFPKNLPRRDLWQFVDNLPVFRIPPSHADAKVLEKQIASKVGHLCTVVRV